MKIKQAAIQVIVPVRIVDSLDGYESVDVIFGGRRYQLDHFTSQDMPPEIAEAVRAAVDWEAT